MTCKCLMHHVVSCGSFKDIGYRHGKSFFLNRTILKLYIIITFSVVLHVHVCDVPFPLRYSCQCHAGQVHIEVHDLGRIKRRIVTLNSLPCYELFIQFGRILLVSPIEWNPLASFFYAALFSVNYSWVPLRRRLSKVVEGENVEDAPKTSKLHRVCWPSIRLPKTVGGGGISTLLNTRRPSITYR